ncbi:class I adenylate-forming enzyme family protein [Aliikangiella coralliicola]|uniref:Acyl--CoA ligase n=1 Tax=Aliikangiella coralliicola TaxID=2592383 RepID=A0A545UHF8_9GAMM|nr:class I adenylate-forming enzyme family protein [Aliikangiella coralliicola]TQV88911.1 acyl--CoA ligase [Aliikangiella coralliicola]
MYQSTLPGQFLSISESQADSIALQSNAEQVSYGDLKRRVDKVGSYFKQIGIEPGDRVALVIDNSVDYVTAFYAIWKVGGIVVSLNPQAKFHEIEKLIQQCEAKCLLIDKLNHANTEQLNQLSINMITLNQCDINGVANWSTALECEADNNWYSATEDTLAQIIYTSGTTGNPKGVLLSHGNLMCNVKDIIEYLELTREDSVLNVLPFHYCYGNSVLHTHFSVGGKVILAGSMAFPQEIVNTMREYKATGFSGVPSTFSLFLARSDWPQDPPPLRYMTQAGGPMGKELTQKLLQSSQPDTKLYVMYGQTEACARISWLPPHKLDEKLGSAGISLTHVDLEIRDENAQALPNGQKGEVYVKGPSIMQGYWNNAEASEQVLLNGWLKTGDLGYLDDEGYLYLVGRNSDMIKVGAHRINPLELEEVINKLGFVQESAVIGIEDEILGQKLRAFIVGEESRENLLALKKHCNEYLPTHKIPREIQWAEQLPKTASGKIKRYLLKS